MTSNSHSGATAAQAEARFRQGWGAHQRGQLNEAWAAYQDVLKLQPRHFNALHMAGLIAAQSRQFDIAVDLISRAVAVNPNNADAHFNRGNALRDLKQFKDAAASFDNAIRLQPHFAEAHNNRGIMLKELGDLNAAVASYDKAIQFKPDYAEAYNNRGNAQRAINDLQGAVASFAKALALRPDYADAHYNHGLALCALKQFPAALESFYKATQLSPGHAVAFHGAGQALSSQRQFQTAMGLFDQALRLKPDYAEAYNSRGIALKELRQADAALAALSKAIDLKADYVEALTNRGHLLCELRRFSEALRDYDQALKIDPTQGLLAGARVHAKMQLCNWKDHDQELAQLLEKIARGEKAAIPFQCLTFTDDAALHRKSSDIWTASEFPRDYALGPIPKRSRREKIRIGYFSVDFRIHPVAVLAAGLIDNHDRQKFEVYGFSYGPDTGDPMRKRLESAFDVFKDVSALTNTDVTALARALEIDIAVDLGGYTNNARTQIFAGLAAPIQVNYLGYPGTMGTAWGAAYYQYMLADKTVVPADVRPHYAEKIAFLPRCYQPNDTSRVVSDRVFTRDALGLPREGFVFCCLNNTSKITPGIFDIWMRILKQVEGSVLWLLEDNAEAAVNLRKEAEARSVTPERIVFAPRAPQADHLARQRAADLFLDTLPYNAHTSASDALWVGLPLLTCAGNAFAGRVAASILGAMDLPELITSNAVDYEAKAVALAKNPERLADIKRRLEENRLTTALFDAKAHARGVETAYSRMIERYHADQPPEDILI